jgi:serine protease Do
MPGFSAEKAGLKEGDVIRAVNTTPVTNREQVVESLLDLHEGQTVQLSILRGEEQFDTQLQLMSLKSSPLGDGIRAQERLDRLGAEVSSRAEGFDQAIEHDTVLRPWLCGGPLVNLQGKAIGINIARASRVTTFALPAPLVQKILARLKAEEKLP